MKAKLWKSDFTPLRDLAQNLSALPTAVALDAENNRAFVGDARGMVLVFNIADAKPIGEIQTNPPAIATRMEILSGQISALEKQATPEAQAQLPVMQAALKRWSAAAINTRSLEARKLAETETIRTEEAQSAFTNAARNVTQQAERLNQKRAERDLLSSRGDTLGWSPEARAEIGATLSAIDIVISRELESMREAEAELDRIRQAIDPAALLAHSKKTEAENLQQAYHKALE